MPPGDKRDALTDDAAECRARWGCPGGLRSPGRLPPDLAAEARHVSRVTGTPEASTCPLACVTYATPWVVEITRAVGLASDMHVPLTDALGRDLTAADVAALAALKQAQHEAWKSNEKIREAELAAERDRAAHRR